MTIFFKSYEYDLYVNNIYYCHIDIVKICVYSLNTIHIINISRQLFY